MGIYSKDLRIRAVDAVELGIPRREVVETFSISLTTLKRWLRMSREGRDLSPGTSTGRRRRILTTLEEKRALWKQLQENDDATLEQHCEMWEEEWGVRVSVSAMSRAIREKLWAGPTKKDCEYCEHGARDVSSRRSDPKKRGLRVFPAIRRPTGRASRHHRSESRVTS